ncbi:protein-glutamine gamma-glutamyltransferase [Bacillus sp. HMF5848]|uniref:protein-glutamine gamma-glutamyltransferase n=1 Tax=Bacillus sp. HMF5848 TaxID=2495421 RepID=UPI000F7B0255|nr:protein-glutamine gamma-glutamyltransferase [Bacillus sp. HMF5848]RSK28293.1 protein-glutamine gamma-glutamyltransferase [Bacillus sp. HMF5848]
MIKIQYNTIPISNLLEMFPNQPYITILRKMAQYRNIYRYDSFEQLHFELILRTATIKAANDLYKSGVEFATFSTTISNPQYWNRSGKGEIILKRGRLPSDAIQDIFNNGTLYAFECATAMLVVFYKAVLDCIDVRAFNSLYSNLVLYDWKYDKDLYIETTIGDDFLLGDCIYFKNPQFDPNTPQWQGENAIILGEDLYFGHGIGIGSAAFIIENLNERRQPGANRSAYLKDQVTRPGYKSLAKYRKKDLFIPSRSKKTPTDFILATIGSTTFIT